MTQVCTVCPPAHSANNTKKPHGTSCQWFLTCLFFFPFRFVHNVATVMCVCFLQACIFICSRVKEKRSCLLVQAGMLWCFGVEERLGMLRPYQSQCEK